jgi:hypothetical protein
VRHPAGEGPVSSSWPQEPVAEVLRTMQDAKGLL